MANLDSAIQQVSSALVETLQTLSRSYSTNAASTSDNISSRRVSPPRLVSLKYTYVKFHFRNYVLYIFKALSNKIDGIKQLY